MVNYKIVKYCKMCNSRFVVDKGESKRFYCDTCQSKVDRDKNTETGVN